MPIWHHNENSGWKNCYQPETGSEAGENAKTSPEDAQKYNVSKPKLSLLTLNVWFGRFKFDERTHQQIALFQELNPDFICLQEGM